MKSLHIALTALGAVIFSLGTPQAAQAQFRTPTIDGASSLAEYGNEYASPTNDDPNLKWRITWDDTNLYVAIEDANLQEGAILYLDVDPQTPVNTTGRLKGFNNYLSTNGNLPIEADIVIYAEKFEHQFRRYDRQAGVWGERQVWGITAADGNSYNGLGQYADNATGEETGSEDCENGVSDDVNWSECRPETNFSGTVKEFSLPWSAIGVLTDPANPNSPRKRPENFNWFGHIHFAYDPISSDDPDTPQQEPNIPNDFLGGIYGQVPRENENSARQNDIPEKGLKYVDYNWSYYFTVLNTSVGSDNTAFGPRLGPDNTPVYSYSHTGESIANFGSFRAYDFTVNTPGATIARTDKNRDGSDIIFPNTAEWNILGNLVVGPTSTLNLDPAAAPVYISRNLILTVSEIGTGVFSFQNTADRAILGVGGDIIFTDPASFQTTAQVNLTGNGPQSISGDTYRALTVQGSGIKTLIGGNLTISSRLTLDNGTLATGANQVLLDGAANLEENNGYLLGSILTTRTINNNAPSNFGGIGLTLRSNVGQLETVTVERITAGFGVNGDPTNPSSNKTIRRRFRILSTRETAPNRTLEFTYRNANPSELEGNNPANLQLYSSVDRTGFYSSVGTVTPASGPSTSNTATLIFNGSLTFNNNYFSLSSNNAPLPVELISFTGKAENKTVRLTWATASELQNKGFEIERRTVSGEWTTLGFVAGNGTSSQRNNYTYVDRSASAGNNYYRLRQIDLDGKSVYSQPITVQLGGNGQMAFSVSPVPTTDVLTINGLSAGKHVAEIYNARGQRVMRQEFNDSTPAALSVRTLPVGVYMIRVLGANRSTQNARFIKQ
ncbi:T9SS type A sorting domain-containing protein [Hymenobacter sp. BT188]|uniref:T9SS type A sorting domain-containing protein n=1 Tax=Hymenobacter sp. BT188 TaxID=2763504 RepID=UPI00165176A6|nr:T9SS type A sorting domain-containing protein [Hymenobacter sp. BT188]MBC6607273.1 T9SS type A sorting domain-containing protein [Hymenobacter sp. BT188]